MYLTLQTGIGWKKDRQCSYRGLHSADRLYAGYSSHESEAYMQETVLIRQPSRMLANPRTPLIGRSQPLP